ncbi:YgiQ family radical SAM protein [Phaeovibrio sulfidiphilus]|uniref:YgiQ family radical SAM protein n=1 Tax=Phaeovibrio sulfidiphilus TaxID=1220600 RepID=UPI0018D5C86A|nr:YgiQ family radical SAM protein [Phaeovibrio sulfidiphilus]
MSSPASLFSRKPWWASRLGPAPFLPTTRAEMDALGWDACDVVLVTGDAYVDHPSFGMALIGRLLEARGFRVGIISQPDWTSAEAFRALGRPVLYFGVTAGNMDSMVNRYTADRKLRREDAYTAGGEAGCRPDRAATVYAQRCREAYRDVPVVLGGIEASLRRFAHYDYWSDTVRRSVLLDSKADVILYGNAERALVDLTFRLARGEPISSMLDLRGAAFALGGSLEEHQEASGALVPHSTLLRLPGFEEVSADPQAYLEASRQMHRESNPFRPSTLVQRHGNRDLVVTPAPLPLPTDDLDRVFELPYARAPHPSYGSLTIPAWEMIRHSVTIVRGCFGGCSFCAITSHEGRVIQSRSTASIEREVERVRDRTEGFTGVISDLGGPSANMWQLGCRDPALQAVCRRWSCLHPDICAHLETDQGPLVDLYRKVRAIPGVKKVVVASGLRYDLALRSTRYVRELVTHHVGGYLKVAPEHTEPGVLKLMLKPGMDRFEQFSTLFRQYSKEAGKEQYLIPYFIAAHPGTTDADMLNLALWLKRNDVRPDQVQTFLPTPMTLSSAMYHAGANPMVQSRDGAFEALSSAKGLRQRRLQKALLRWHDSKNWPLIREALKAMGRTDLIGPSKRHLVPAARYDTGPVRDTPAWRTSARGAGPASGATLGTGKGRGTAKDRGPVKGTGSGTGKSTGTGARPGPGAGPLGPRDTPRRPTGRRTR